MNTKEGEAGTSTPARIDVAALYREAADVYRNDDSPTDQVASALSDAYVMLATVTGEGLTSFQNLNDKLQGDYLYAIYSRVRAARLGFELMMEEQVRDHG